MPDNDLAACMRRLKPIVERGDMDDVAECQQAIQDYLLAAEKGEADAACKLTTALRSVHPEGRRSSDVIRLMLSYLDAQIDPAAPPPLREH